MKKFILFIFILILLMVYGCKSQQTSMVSELPKPIIFTGENPGEIKIIYPMSQFSHPEDEFISHWQKYMLDRHNLDINLIYTKEYLPYDVEKRGVAYTGVNTTDIENHTDGGGFVYLKHAENLGALKDSGLVVPVNDYIYRTPSLAVLDETCLNPFADGEGNIWAVPLSDTSSVSYSRLYNKEWLGKWGGKIPETIDELYDFACFIRDNDPDGNGQNDTYLQMVNNNYFLSDLSDIFKAFGCYVDGGQSPIVFNPQSGKYENVLLTEGFSEAMIFIKNLYDEGLLLFTDTLSWEWEEFPYNVATANGSAAQLLKTDDAAAGYYLKGTNETDLIRSGVSQYCLMVLAGTEDVPEKLEYLIQKLKESPGCVPDIRCGIENISYKEYQDYYTFFYINEEDRVSTPNIGIFTYFRTDNYKPIVTAIFEDELNPESIIASEKIYNFLQPGSSAALKSNLAYSISYFTTNNEINHLNTKLRATQNKLIADVLSGIVTIEDAIEEYRNATDKMYIPDEVVKFNDLLP